MVRWFFKTTESIPVAADVALPLGTVDGIRYRVMTVSAGINTDTGRVYINYNYYGGFSFPFWLAHFHEFLHRIFWLLKWDLGDKILDFVDKKFWWASVVKDFRTGTSKVINRNT